MEKLESVETEHFPKSRMENAKIILEPNPINKWKSLIQALKYTLVTASAGLLEFLSFTIMVNIWKGAPNIILIAEVISLALSVIWNFTVNRKVTFKSTSNVARGMIIIAIFYCGFFPFSAWFVPWLTNKGVHELASKIIKMLINFVLEFSTYKFIIFREKPVGKKKKKSKKNLVKANNKGNIVKA